MHLFLQVVTDTGAKVVSTLTTGNQSTGQLSFLDLMIKGGWVMIPILILSVLAVYFTIERYLVIRKAAHIDQNFMANIRDFLMTGRMDSAMSLCRNTNTPIARLLYKGMKRVGKPIQEIEGAVESEGRLEIYKLERNMQFLGIISGIAPMFGFLGTIAGVIKIFFTISVEKNISIDIIAGGLYEKMITSACGLVVGIFAHISFNYLNSMVDRVSYQIENAAVEFIDVIQEPAAA